MSRLVVESRDEISAADLAALPHRSARLFGWFSWWVPRYLKRHFHAVRVSGDGHHRSLAPRQPLVFVMNHPSWWDPLIGVVLARLFPERTHFAPMDAHALSRYKLFDKLGFYGVEQGTSRGGAAFLKTTRAILSQPNTAVWITAQGAFTDARVRPVRLRPGVGHLAARMTGGVIVPVALEYAFWSERFPEALVRFGEPVFIENEASRRSVQWVEFIETRLQATQDDLAVDAIARNPERFETLVAGGAGIGGLYDLFRRFRASVEQKPFQAEHGSRGGRA